MSLPVRCCRPETAAGVPEPTPIRLPMNAPLRSRDLVNPFLTPDAPTLAEVFDRLNEVPLSPTRRRDCQSALRRLSEITGEPLSVIPADAQVVRQKLEAAAPVLSRLSAKTRANLRSSLL